MKRHLVSIFMLAAAASILAIEPAGKPTFATIVNVHSGRSEDIGNVKVRFSDGHSEIWTSRGRCMIPHVSPAGCVGWTYYTGFNDYQQPVNSTLRLRFPNGRIKDFSSLYHGPFIEEWGFVDRDLAVVIKSRSSHGPPYFIKYDIANGRVLGTVEVSTTYDDLPDWAKPYSDDRPRSAAH